MSYGGLLEEPEFRAEGNHQISLGYIHHFSKSLMITITSHTFWNIVREHKVLVNKTGFPFPLFIFFRKTRYFFLGNSLFIVFLFSFHV